MVTSSSGIDQDGTAGTRRRGLEWLRDRDEK